MRLATTYQKAMYRFVFILYFTELEYADIIRAHGKETKFRVLFDRNGFVQLIPDIKGWTISERARSLQVSSPFVSNVYVPSRITSFKGIAVTMLHNNTPQFRAPSEFVYADLGGDGRKTRNGYGSIRGRARSLVEREIRPISYNRINDLRNSRAAVSRIFLSNLESEDLLRQLKLYIWKDKVFGTTFGKTIKKVFPMTPVISDLIIEQYQVLLSASIINKSGYVKLHKPINLADMKGISEYAIVTGCSFTAHFGNTPRGDFHLPLDNHEYQFLNVYVFLTVFGDGGHVSTRRITKMDFIEHNTMLAQFNANVELRSRNMNISGLVGLDIPSDVQPETESANDNSDKTTVRSA